MDAVRQPELLEREDALAAVGDLLATIDRREGSVLVIAAPAGLGKTALLAAVRERAERRGFMVSSARGGEFEREFPFGLVRQLFEPAVAGATAAERKALFQGAARLASPLLGPARDTDVASPVLGGLGHAAGAAMHGLYWLAVNLAEGGPLLLCVDDAHWGDTSSLGWLAYLARRLGGLPLAVVLATRPGEPGADHELLTAITAEPLSRVVRLEPLTAEGSARIVRLALGSEADDRFCAACHELTGGNPFLLREVTEALERDRVEPSAASVALVRDFVPEAVARSLLLRLARLPKAASALARAVAVLGGDASLQDAALLAELEAREAARAAALLAAVGILAPGLRLEFVHPLVRAAVYGDVPEIERALWHAGAARVLAAAGGRPERIAAQLLRTEPAGDRWVVERLREAATDAVARADPRSAVAFLRRAFVEPAHVDERIPILQDLAQAGFFAPGSFPTDGLGTDAVTEIARDRRALQASALYLVMPLWSRGRASEALAVLGQALSAARADGDLDLALRIEARSITLAQLLPPEALRRLVPYKERVEVDSFAGRLVDASIAWYGSLTGHRASEVVEHGRRAFAGLRLVSELQDDDVMLSTFVLPLLRADELALCESIIEQILNQGRAKGSASTVAGGSHLSATLSQQRGDIAGAEGHIVAAVAVLREAGIIAPLPPMLGLLINTLTDRREMAAAEDELVRSGMNRQIPDHWWFGIVLWSRGYLRLAQGRADEAVADLLEFARRWHRDGLVPTVIRPWASLAAPLVAQQGNAAEARRLAERELDEARAWGTPRAIGQALRGLGLVTGGAAGIELLCDSVRTLESSPARLEHARALIDLGATLRRANQRAQAREPLRRGLELADRGGVRLLVAQAEQELRATGARPRRAVLSGVEALTASERRIAEMATQGLSNRDIAQALFVTIKTVETHMAHVFQKLDIKSRNELGPLLLQATN